jgi:hypothetical protein
MAAAPRQSPLQSDARNGVNAYSRVAEGRKQREYLLRVFSEIGPLARFSQKRQLADHNRLLTAAPRV